jgi:hypothetical protein
MVAASYEGKALSSVPLRRRSTAPKGIFGALVFSLSPISCFVFWRRFRQDPNWQHLKGWTLAAGIITTAAVILLSASTKTQVIPNVFTPWNGLIQRMVIIPYLS